MFKYKNKSWKNILQNEFNSNYFNRIKKRHKKAINSKLEIYPKRRDIFKAFNLTDFDKIKVVIIAQEPYNTSYANGLAFSVDKGKIPGSLKNIFNELKKDLDIDNTNTDLTSWAKQGVLLLNSFLTVYKDKPKSHRYWKKFTNNIIKTISKDLDNVIFILWGNEALIKKQFIDDKKHHVFISSHPSPNSAFNKLKTYPKFNGSKVFSKVNNKLIELNKKPINWKT